MWRLELSNSGTLAAGQCRAVQDEVFRLRVRGLQVPEWFYWLTRKRNEANMHEAASARRDQHARAVQPPPAPTAPA